MEGVCCFDRGKVCGILSGEKRCKDCKFFKTESQFYFEASRAEKILQDKGLESYQAPDGSISTRKIREDY